MKVLFLVSVLTASLGMMQAPVVAAQVSTIELYKAATILGHEYDMNYAAKNPAAMAGLYTMDGVLVSPSGPVVRGRAALRMYYAKRFASGARHHAITVVEVHVLGDGGYGLCRFSVMVPRANGTLHEQRGTIVAVYQHDADGWHLRLVQPSVPESPAK